MDSEIQQKMNKIVEWLREQVEKSNTSGLVVGVSGGIDSALVSFLIKKAFPSHSMGVVLPCKSHGKDREDALKVIEACGIEHVEIDLTSAHDLIFNQVMHCLKARNLDASAHSVQLSDANLRARLRMSTLYSIANAKNYLVVGTDNAAETFTGYFTKYGDGGVDILPIANLLKREVRAWSKELRIPKEVIEKSPSAGLWEGQTDENEIGTTYDRIDQYLEGKEIPKKDLDIIMKLHKNSRHKRQMPAVPPNF